MNDFSRFSGTSPVTPASGKVWAVGKKRKLGDRNRENGKNKRNTKEEKEPLESQAVENAVSEEETVGETMPEETYRYGSSKPKKRYTKKVDIII